MGIEHFYNWVKTTYPKAILNVTAQNIYEGIYIDCNHLLHNCITNADNIDEFKSSLKSCFDILFSNFLATKHVVIGVDGPAPYAKVVLQRKRRNTNVIVSEFDSMHLTPGTNVMYKVDEFISEYLAKLANTYRVIKPATEYIGSSVPDEGELKIFNKLKLNNTKTNLVIGNDADLIVMAVSMTSCDHINILLHHKDGKELFCLERFIEIYKNDINIPELNINILRLDFALLSILQGNDYLPKLNYVNFDNTFSTYKQTVSRYKTGLLLDGLTIDIPMFINFLMRLLLNLPKHYSVFKMEKFDYSEIKNYFLGLLWCLNMYNTGQCSMYDYVYIGKKAPSPVNLLMFCMINRESMIETPISSVTPLNVDYYTFLIMPKKAKVLVPKKYHGLMDGKFKYLYDREVCEDCNEYKGKLSKYHTKLIAIKKESGDNTSVRKKLSEVNISFNSHKKEKHNITFGINDIKNIVFFISMKKL